MNQMMIAQALAKFQVHIGDNIGRPITLVTVGLFAKMITDIVAAIHWSDGDKKE